jgi:Raf kinase inhibitor-like YbhB/YbcL family protein
MFLSEARKLSGFGSNDRLRLPVARMNFMEEKHMIRTIALIATAGAALALGSVAAAAADDQAPRPKLFTLYSPAMRSFGYIPDKYAGNNPQNHNCSGENVSLPLNWSNPPEGTKSFAITMVDPVPRGGQGFVHWVAYDIAPTWNHLREGEASNPNPKGFVGGKNGAGDTAWRGPCPPPTDYPHPYTIELVATDVAPGTLKPGMTRDELIAALQGHVLGATTFIARYHKPAGAS